MEFHIEIVSAQDGRECILATGNTAAKKEQLSAAGFQLEPATKNLVEVCSIAERAVLDGAALSVSGYQHGRNGWTEQSEIRERKGC